jgi:hypothetical protein
VRFIFLVAFLVILVGTGCASQSESALEKNNPGIQDMTLCTAGVLSGYKAGATFETDFNIAKSQGQFDISVGAEVNKWLHGYIFAKIPGDQALEAYKFYLKCLDNRATERRGMDVRLVPLKNRSDDLFKRFQEAEIYKFPVIISDENKYAVLGKQLTLLDPLSLKLKDRWIKYDHEALMYTCAAEIIIRNAMPQERKTYSKKAKVYATSAYKAAKAGRLTYEEINSSQQKSVDILNWLEREEVDLLSLHRLSDSLAQLIFLGNAKSRDELNAVLEDIPCNYIKKYNLNKDVLYDRIAPIPWIIGCTK